MHAATTHARRWRTARLFAAVVAGLAIALPALVLPHEATAQTTPTLSLLGDEPLVVTASQGKDTRDTSFWVLNTGPTAHLTLNLRAEDYSQPAQPDKRLRIASWNSTVVQHDATRINVVLAGLNQLRHKKVDTQFVLSDGQTTLARAATIVPAAHPLTNWPKWILIGSAISAAGIVIAVLLLAFFREGIAGLRMLGGRAPGAKWGWDSWGASLTIVAGIFGTVIAKVTLPAVPDQIDQNTLVQLNLFFAVMLVVGPFIFQAIRRPVAPQAEVETLWGYSPVLLAAYAISGAAVLGELACLELLTWELTLGNGPVLRWTLIAAVPALAIAAFYYIVVVAYDQVSINWDDAAAVPAPTAPPAPEAIAGNGHAAAARKAPKLYTRML